MRLLQALFEEAVAVISSEGTLPQVLSRYWLTQAKATLCMTDVQGRSCDLLTFLQQQERDEVDVWVQVGKRDRLPARLIAVRVSAQTAQGRRQPANQRMTLPPQRVAGACPRQAQVQAGECGALSRAY